MTGLNADTLYIIIRAALDAGKAIMNIYSDPTADFEVERKADNSPLTKADKESNAIISTALSNTSIPLLSEEGSAIPYSERLHWKRLWVVDPLDGTKEFIKKNGEFTVNIALVDFGIPIMGVIYVPVNRELYFGADTLGAWKIKDIDNESVPPMDILFKTATKLPYAETHQGYVVVASRSHLNEETLAFIDKLREEGKPLSLINSGSSLKICRVAEGSADIYPRFAPTMEWDTAAGHAIIRAAGKNIYQTDGTTPLIYNKEDLHNPWFIVK